MKPNVILLLMTITVVVLCWLTPHPTIPPQQDPDTLTVTVVKVIDGDTIKVNIPGWPATVGEAIPVRIRYIDTPELRGKCTGEKIMAVEAKETVKRLIASTSVITLENVSRGKYFRLVADVRLDGDNLATTLLDMGLAVIDTGKGSKFNWCE